MCGYGPVTAQSKQKRPNCALMAAQHDNYIIKQVVFLVFLRLVNDGNDFAKYKSLSCLQTMPNAPNYSIR